MLWKKAAILGMIGFVLGAAICVGFILSSSGELHGSDLSHILLGAIYGSVAMGSSVIYEIEKWSIFRVTATHFLLIFSLYCAIGFSIGWFSLSYPAFWIIMAVMVTGYVLIWLIQYLSYKRKIQRLNDDLKKWRSSEEGD